MGSSVEIKFNKLIELIFLKEKKTQLIKNSVNVWDLIELFSEEILYYLFSYYNMENSILPRNEIFFYNIVININILETFFLQD